MHAHPLLERHHARALQVAPYGDDRLVRLLTRQLVAQGHVILQTHRLGVTDLDHVEALLDWFAPPAGASILDVGCGVGAVAAFMTECRPDLRFTLLNISGSQLELAPAGMTKVRADLHELPFDAGSFDAVMFNYSLGHGLLDRCLAEAARVLRSGGVLFIYDLATANHAYLVDHLGYRPHSEGEVLDAADRHGLGLDIVERPASRSADFVA